VKPIPLNPATGRVQFLALAISLSIWAAYLQAGLPFNVPENTILHRLGLATGWAGNSAFFPQCILALLVGTCWQFYARCSWPAQSGHAWRFYLAVALILVLSFLGLRYGYAGGIELRPIAGIIVGLTLGGGCGWLLPLAAMRQRMSSWPALWTVAVLGALAVTMLPLNTQATLGQTAFSGWDISERVYQLLKPAMLWGALGLVCGLSGYGRQARAGGGAAILGFLVCVAFAPQIFRFEDVVEVMALLPGLATGLWLGERSRLTDSISPAVPSETPETVAAVMATNSPRAVIIENTDSNRALSSDSSMPDTGQSHHEPENEAEYQHPASAVLMYARRASALMLLAVVGWALLDFPRWNVPLAAGFVLYFALLLRYPKAWLLIVPAALPLLDLAFWTGRFFLDEFDLLLMVTLAALLFRAPLKRSDTKIPLVFAALLMASVVISGVIGLLPLQSLDANAFASYFSHYNSLRIAKGFLWGMVLFVMLRPHLAKAQAMKLLSGGMLIGLAGVALSALWEYWRFSDSSALDYRVTANFSSMHIGGGHIEAYLVCALPFTWLLLWQDKRIWIKAIATCVFFLAIYALIATVARGGIVALAAVFLILATGMYRTMRVRGMSRRVKYTGSILLVSGIAVLIAGLVSATFLQQRFSQTDADAQTRYTHWSKSVGLLQNNWHEWLFGAGLGRYPERYFFANFDAGMGSYRYQTEGDQHFLSLNSGGTLYMAQRVAVTPGTPYTLEVDVRSNGQANNLTISICEKKLFNSHLCVWLNTPVTPGAGWQHQTIEFSSGEVGQGAWWSRRPVQLSLYNPQEKSIVDVGNLRLTDSSGVNLIANGDFAQGGDHWLFNSGNHLVWHTKSMWVHLLFEQGLFGLIIFAVLTLVAVRQLIRRSWAGEPHAAVWLASLSGLLIIGVVDSLFDAPRLAMLLVMTVLVGASYQTQRSLIAPSD